MPEAIVAALGAAAIGAVWSSCSPDFGVQGVLDRFGQIEPKVLVAADGYSYGGKTHDCLAAARGDRRARLPTLRQIVVVPYVERGAAIAGIERASLWHEFLGLGTAADLRRSSASRSTIRSTSCTRRAPPACRSASCTAPAAR